MKKLLLLLILTMPCISIADTLDGVVIFNKSKQYDMAVTYRICSYKSHDAQCTPTNELVVPAKRTPTDKNYYKIFPEKTYDEETFVELMTVIEKNSQGDVIAKSDYVIGGFNGRGKCMAHISSNPGTRFALILDDMEQSPYIVCTSDFGTYF